MSCQKGVTDASTFQCCRPESCCTWATEPKSALNHVHPSNAPVLCAHHLSTL